MDQGRLIQPASRDQIVAIIRQRAERANRDLPAQLGQALFPAPAFIDFPPGQRQPERREERGGYVPLYRQAALPPEEELKPRMERLAVVENNLVYRGERGMPGVYISSVSLSEEKPYFEVEITNADIEGESCGPIIGLCSNRYPLDLLPGWSLHSVGYNTADGKLYKGKPRGQAFGSRCQTGDKVGCGIKFEAVSKKPLSAGMMPVFFTKNGKEIGTQLIASPPGGLFPAIGLQREPQEVSLPSEGRWVPEEDIAMAIDCGEEDWRRLHDIRLNGQVLEYIGKGKTLVDVGLAQARTPLTTRTHYFEVEIMDPGSSCYIAIGLAKKDYPKDRHPGWNKGSIAYHADDGKVFMGSGQGSPFGPRCSKGDIMGCGVLFPRDFECKSDSEEEGAGEGSRSDDANAEAEEYETDSGEEEEWWKPVGDKVQVYFTRNGKIIGKKDVVLPRGGFFYPTVGMMSSQEKVKVDLRPLSG